jgi:hypothetical protein
LRRRPILGVEAGKRFAEARPGDVAFGHLAEAEEVFGGIILAEIRAHAVEAAVIHQIGALERGLAALDVLRRHRGGAVRGKEAVRLRRRPAVGHVGRPTEKGKGENGDGQQDPFENVADPVLLQPSHDGCAAVHRTPSLPLGARRSRR